ncbi:hypothetical protein NECID01_1003 [Nematocida sp. AWRm77]|nr:hypothetical protein NECID01_1003 [Nematocida sp. AWRm77]
MISTIQCTLNVFILKSFLMVRTFYYAWTILLKCMVLVCSTNINTLDFKVITEVEMLCANINPDNACSSCSGIPNSLPRVSLQNDASDARQSVLQVNQTPGVSCPLDAPGPSNTVNTVGVNEGSSASLPSTSTSSNTSSTPSSSISSVQVQSTAGSAKRPCDTAEKKDRKQRSRKRQKTKTTVAKANAALMDEAEVRLAVEKFNKYFGYNTIVWVFLSRDMVEFANDLGLRGLTSVHSIEIVEQCTAPKQWRGRDGFWRMLMFFMDTLSLEVVEINRLEDKKTVVLRNRKIRDKPLSECRSDYICKIINKFRGAERMEMQCRLSYLVNMSTPNVLPVFRWLLHHVNIQCVGVTCDLTETEISSEVLGRQIAALTKEWKGNTIHIDSLAVHFKLAQYKEAAVILKECSSIPVLKIHFLDAALFQGNNRKQALEFLLLHCSALEQLSIFGVAVDIEHIKMIIPMHPKLELLEIESLILGKLELSLEEEEKSVREEVAPEFPSLRTLKLMSIYNISCFDETKLIDFFPNLKCVQLSSKTTNILMIDALSNLRLLRSLETVNGLLSAETVVYLLERLPTLECLSVGVKELGNNLAHALSKYTGMHTLNLRGSYTAGFLTSLLQPSPLMSTLKFLEIYKHPNTFNDNFTSEDISSKKGSMKRFGCVIKIKH